MLQIDNITNDNFQKINILFEESEITLHLKFYTILQQWFFDVSYKDFNLFGKHITVSTYHLLTSNQPFDFIAVDTSQTGLDPFRADDFSDGRVALLMLEPNDLQEIRGERVPL